jgi:hypothetical protein
MEAFVSISARKALCSSPGLCERLEVPVVERANGSSNRGRGLIWWDYNVDISKLDLGCERTPDASKHPNASTHSDMTCEIPLGDARPTEARRRLRS